jgi:transporter family-2 protein
MLGAVMTGQIVGSIVMDHFGVAGYSVRPVSPERIGGVVLLLMGVLLIQRS